jgi:hypothetical protein
MFALTLHIYMYLHYLIKNGHLPTIQNVCKQIHQLYSSKTNYTR